MEVEEKHGAAFADLVSKHQKVLTMVLFDYLCKKYLFL
jgi:hypothetical protein